MLPASTFGAATIASLHRGARLKRKSRRRDARENRYFRRYLQLGQKTPASAFSPSLADAADCGMRLACERLEKTGAAQPMHAPSGHGQDGNDRPKTTKPGSGRCRLPGPTASTRLSRSSRSRRVWSLPLEARDCSLKCRSEDTEQMALNATVALWRNLLFLSFGRTPATCRCLHYSHANRELPIFFAINFTCMTLQTM